MKKAVLIIGSWKKQQIKYLENVTDVTIDTDRYNGLAPKVNIIIQTMSGDRFVIEHMRISTAKQYIDKMNLEGCLDLTKSYNNMTFKTNLIIQCMHDTMSEREPEGACILMANGEY